MKLNGKQDIFNRKLSTSLQVWVSQTILERDTVYHCLSTSNNSLRLWHDLVDDA